MSKNVTQLLKEVIEMCDMITASTFKRPTENTPIPFKNITWIFTGRTDLDH